MLTIFFNIVVIGKVYMFVLYLNKLDIINFHSKYKDILINFEIIYIFVSETVLYDNLFYVYF